MSQYSAKIELLGAAQSARNLSYSPYSKFRVGAALLLQSGQFVLGANIENASYGGTICAERTALVKYASTREMFHAEKKDRIIAIAVASDLGEPVSPCGICRQFIREFCSLDTLILMVDQRWQAGEPEDLLREETGLTIRTLEQLLPLSFGPEHIERSNAAQR